MELDIMCDILLKYPSYKRKIRIYYLQQKALLGQIPYHIMLIDGKNEMILKCQQHIFTYWIRI